jgi:hypothetical protein
MNLYLSKYSPINSLYTHESGQVLYRVATPFALGPRLSRVFKVIPNNSDRMERLHVADPTDAEAVENALQDEDLQDKFEEIGQVQHNVVDSSIIRFGGEEMMTCSYFTKEDWGAHGR